MWKETTSPTSFECLMWHSFLKFLQGHYAKAYQKMLHHLQFTSIFQKVIVLVTLSSKLLYANLANEKAKDLSTCPSSPSVMNAPRSLTLTFTQFQVAHG